MAARFNRSNRLVLVSTGFGMMLVSMANGIAAGVLGSSLFKDVKADSPYDAAIE